MMLCPSCQSPLPPSGLCGRCVFARLEETGGEPVRRMGDYELMEELDHGGMGVVWRARHRELGRIVALKMIRGGSVAGESEIVRFRTEAEAVARLEHPGIVPVFELGEAEGLPFFTMPLLTGGSLQRRLAERKTLPPREAAVIVMKIARAVAHAHGRGVLHRDLKPANVLFDAEGEPHVADFGLARLMESDSDLTRTGAVLGTPAYAAPEQIRGDAPTTAGDVFSLGAILYHLLAGRPPWQGQDALAAMRAAAESEPPTVRSLLPSLPRDLDTVVSRCLDREPSRRYASAELLAEDLARWLRGEPVLARPVSTPERIWKWMRRRPAAAALVLLALVSLALLFIQQVHSERRLRAENLITQRAEAKARANAKELRRSLYAADMTQAIRYVTEGNHVLARGILERQVPADGAEDLRGFDWHWCRHETRNRAAAILTGHTGAVKAVAFAPDGSLLASAGSDGVIRLWQMPGGQPLRTLPAGGTESNPAAILVDRLKFTPRLLRFPHVRAASASEIDIIGAGATRGHLSSINTLSFSRDGKLLAAGSSRNTKVWRVADGELAHVIPLEHCMAVFSPLDDRLFISHGYQQDYGTGTGTVTGWNLTDETQLPGDFGRTTVPLRFCGDGALIATAFKNEPIIIRAATDAREVHRSDLLGGQNIRAHAYDAHGQISARAGTRPQVVVVRAGKAVTDVLPCGSAQPRTLEWTPDGSMLAAGCDDSSIRRWSVSLAELPTLRGHDGAVNHLAFSPGGKLLASAGEDATVRLWDMSGSSTAPAFQGTGARLLTAAGETFVGGSDDAAILWKDGRRTVLQPPDPSSASARWPLSVAPDGQRAWVLSWLREATGDFINGAGVLERYNLTDGSMEASLPLGAVRYHRGAAMSPCGRFLFSSQRAPAFLSGIIAAIRDARSGAVICRAKINTVLLEHPVFSPGGHLLLIAYSNSLLAVSSKDLSLLWERSGDRFTEPVFLSDSMAMAGSGPHLHLLDTATGKDLAVLSGHTGRMISIAIHPGGQILASTAEDLTIRLWHLPTRRELGIIQSACEPPVTTLTFSTDGRTLIACRGSAPALLFESEPAAAAQNW